MELILGCISYNYITIYNNGAKLFKNGKKQKINVFLVQIALFADDYKQNLLKINLMFWQ
jgi:hypothetical protein